MPRIRGGPAAGRQITVPPNYHHLRPPAPARLAEFSGSELSSARDPPGPVRPDCRGTDLPASPSIYGLGPPPRSRSRPPGLHPLLARTSWDRTRAFLGARGADPPPGAPSPAGAARRGPARLLEPSPAMARARPPPPSPPPPGLLPLLPPLLLLPLLLPAGCRALEGERRRGVRPRLTAPGVARAWARVDPRCGSDEGWAHVGGGSVTRAAPGAGGWVGRTPPELPWRLQLAPRPAVGELWTAGGLTGVERPRKSRPSCELLWANSALAAEKRGPRRPREAKKWGRPTRRGRASETAAGLWRVGAKRTPRLGGGVVSEPVGVEREV